MNNIKCDKCKELGLTFYAEHIKPEEYIEGNKDGKIWIIGLNPKGDILTADTPEKRSKNDFANFDPDSYSYFRDFKKVSSKLYENWKSTKNIIAHTDLVKCFSQKFPPVVNDNYIDAEKIITNCNEHLHSQINNHKPLVIICNGTNVCREMIKFFPPIDLKEPLNSLTSYKYIPPQNGKNDAKHSFWIILSGFIGRIDDRNKRRLGKEIESILKAEKITL